MASTAPDQSQTLDVQEQIVRIDRAIAETQKLYAEVTKIKVDTRILPFSAIAAVTGGAAAFFAAGATFIKLLG